MSCSSAPWSAGLGTGVVRVACRPFSWGAATSVHAQLSTHLDRAKELSVPVTGIVTLALGTTPGVPCGGRRYLPILPCPNPVQDYPQRHSGWFGAPPPGVEPPQSTPALTLTLMFPIACLLPVDLSICGTFQGPLQQKGCPGILPRGQECLHRQPGWPGPLLPGRGMLSPHQLSL